jgi:hypothetical protein
VRLCIVELHSGVRTCIVELQSGVRLALHKHTVGKPYTQEPVTFLTETAQPCDSNTVSV